MSIYPPRVVSVVFFALSALCPLAFSQGQGVLRSPADIEARPPLHVRPYASTSPVGHTPQQIRYAYGVDLLLNGGIDGSNQVIAIVDAYGSPTAQNDLNVFSTAFGLPATTIQIVYGGRKPNRKDAGWALETSLDLQWAHALAPKAKIILAVATSASLTDLLAAVDEAVRNGATVVSMSWGASEFSSEANYESHFLKTGVSFLASSGDSGAGASWPAASPNVVGVGGTSLFFNSDGTVSESAWSGSGGGFSAYFKTPSYQNGFQSNVKRAIPDVSLVADPNTGVAVYDSTPYTGQSGWFQVGGTSASAPMWGAVIALANQARGQSITGSNAALYKLAAASTYGTYYLDIVGGNNGTYPAVVGYDEVTGLGAPIAPAVVSDLGK